MTDTNHTDSTEALVEQVFRELQRIDLEVIDNGMNFEVACQQARDAIRRALQATRSQQVEEAVGEMFNKIKEDIKALEYDTDGNTFKKIVLSRMSSQAWFEALTPNHQD